MSRYYHVFLFSFGCFLSLSSCECNKAALEKVKNQNEHNKIGFQNDSDSSASFDDLNPNASSHLPQLDGGNDSNNNDDNVSIHQSNDHDNVMTDDDDTINENDSDITFIPQIDFDNFSGIYTISGSSLKNYLWAMNYNGDLAFRITDHPHDYFGNIDNLGNSQGHYLYSNGSCSNLIVQGSYDHTQNSYSLSGDICKDSASSVSKNVSFSGSLALNKGFHPDFSGVYKVSLQADTQQTTCAMQNISYSDEIYGVAIITGMASGGVPIGWIVGFEEADNKHFFYTSSKIQVSGKTISGTFIAHNEQDQVIGKILLDIISEPLMQKVFASGKKFITETGCERVFDIISQP